MASDDDDDGRDDVEITMASESVKPDAYDPTRELNEVFEDLETLLKNGDVVGYLTHKGINASLALTAMDGLRAYLQGQKHAAAQDFADVADEIRARLTQGKS